MNLRTSNPDDIKPFLQKLYKSPPDSHKGMNGKVLIIGGSSLFHAASLWSAEVASHFVDMVHYSSTQENNEIFLNLKSQFRNGIVVHKKDLLHYVKEDESILIGPGMLRREITNYKLQITNFNELLKVENEAEYTRQITKYLLKNYHSKRFVIDAGALQMMDKEWLLQLKQSPILTPHQGEFERLFGESIVSLSTDQKKEIVKKYAEKYRCVILLKAVTDIISDGKEIYTVAGGNAGLTKGGSGDILAGLAVSFYSKNNPITSAIVASYIEKAAADKLSQTKGSWYNMTTLIDNIPATLHKLQQYIEN